MKSRASDNPSPAKKFTPDMKAGCHKFTVEKLEIAKNYKGEYIHDNGNCIAYDVTFSNADNAKIKMRMWNTDSGKWVSDNLLRAAGLDPRKVDGYKVEDIYGKEVYACVAAKYYSAQGTPVGKPFEFVVLPDTLSPVRDYDTETPYYFGDPLKGMNPVGTKFIILQELEVVEEPETSKIEDEDPFL